MHPSTEQQGSVAIVGIATQLPSGLAYSHNLDHDEFFEFLLNKGESYERIPADRFNLDAWKGRSLGKVVTEQGSFLKNLSMFDHIEFGVNAKDARAMAVSTRKLLEISFLALLDSGIDYRGRNVGCYMSGIAFDMLGLSDQDEMEARGGFSGIPCMIANRVSYHLDLVGPSVPVDTACSSTLTAMHLALQAVKNGECESAVVGGAQINHRFVDWLQYTQGGILSPDGKCKPFDVSADGFGRSEGAAVVVIKPLEAALRDNDHIYATILGTSINSTGSAAPVSAPVAVAQEAAMKRAFAVAQRDPRAVDFVECHATGTASGDPTEANWVGKNFSRDSELLIGSVKGNVGHLEITAFLASLSKVCSMFKTGIIPPNANLNKPNPAIHWDEYKLKVPVEPTPLPCRAASKRSLVAICSSGIGGSNGHAVVESPPPPLQVINELSVKADPQAPILLMAGGLTPRATTALSDTLVELVTGYENKAALSTVFGRRSRQMTWRSFTVAGTEKNHRFSTPVLAPRKKGPIVFLFSGQGPQNLQMGRELFQTYPVFKRSVLEMDQVFKSLTGESLIDTYGIFGECQNPKVLPEPWPVSMTLPTITVVQIALFDLLHSLGIKPDIVLGHSAGETALIYGSGAGSKEMAVEVAVARGKAMTIAQEAGGTMAALACTSQTALAIIAEVQTTTPGILDIACYNANDAVAIAGAVAPVEAAVKLAKSKGFLAAKLKTSVPVHSAAMDVCKAKYEQLINEVFSRHAGEHQPLVPTWSTITATPFDRQFTAQYYWDGTRSPVLFTQTVEALIATHPNATFIELSPHPVLSGYLDSLGVSSVICPMKRPKVSEPYFERRVLLDALGRLQCFGYNSLDFVALNGATSHEIISSSLPKYPFAPKHVPFAVESSSSVMRQFRTPFGPLNYVGMKINTLTHPALAEHVIKGEPIMPAAGFLEMALEAGARSMWDVEFISMLSLSSERPTPTEFHLDGTSWTVRSPSALQAQLGSQGKLDRLHAKGHLSTIPTNHITEALDIAAVRGRCKPFNAEGFYERLRSFAEYGPTYQRLSVVHCGQDEALVEIRGIEDDISNAPEFVFHPAILDACLHIMIHPSFTGNVEKGVYYLPSKVASVTVHELPKPLPSRICTHIKLRQWTPYEITYDFTVNDMAGNPLLTLRGFEVARHGAVSDPVASRFDMIMEPSDIVIPDLTASPKNGRVTRSQRSNEICRSANGFEEHMGGHAKSHPDTHVSRVRGHNWSATAASLSEFFPSFDFVRGEEIRLQKELSNYDMAKPFSCWLVARSGVDGDAALGFSRSLRKENLAWSIHLVVFDDAISLSQMRSKAVPYLAAIEGVEEELYLDATGRIHHPRLSPLPSPSRRRPYDPEDGWKVVGNSIMHTSLPTLGPDEVLIKVTKRSHLDASVCAFVGTVVDGGDAPIKLGQVVIGLTEGGVISHVAVAYGSLVAVAPHDTALQDRIVMHALGFVVAGLAVGISSLRDPNRLRNAKILVTHADSLVAETTIAVFRHLKIIVANISECPSPDELEKIKRIAFTHAISGASGGANSFTATDHLASNGILYPWNDPRQGVTATLASDPWLVGDMLRLAADLDLLDTNTFGLELAGIPKVAPGDMIPSDARLFDAHKSYILIGGIGSLGIRIALWMYENGARHIVLTSRSGRESLVRGNITAKRITAYLESLPDLSIRLEACDATSMRSTHNLVKKIRQPLGGVMQLTAVFIDRMFGQQNEETFARVYESKTRVMKVIEEVIDIPSLDFFIAFSSASGIVGTAGQTNYGAANTTLDAMTRKYENAFSLPAPAITDSAVGSDTQRLRYLIPWGMTTRQLCDCIEDGLHMIRESSFWLYVPELQWNVVKKNIGSNHFMDHLIIDDLDDLDANGTGGQRTMKDIVLDVLDVDAADFDADVPFTAYGLDSLSAGRLSYALKGFLPVTQLQLLGDLALIDLEERIATAEL